MRKDSLFAASIRAIEDVLENNSLPSAPDNSFESTDKIDINASWTATEEQKVVRKTDVHLLLCFCIMYIAMSMDRGNLHNALTDNLLEDLHLTTNDFNNASTLTRVAFLLSEFPVQCLVLRFGFKNVFPWSVMAWGIVCTLIRRIPEIGNLTLCLATAQAFVTGRAGFYICRLLIGALEGGFIPGVVYFLTFFYTSREMTPRLAILSSISDVGLCSIL